MKKTKSPVKNFAYFFYRLLKPIIDPIKFVQGITGYFWYIRDLIKYKKQDKTFQVDTDLFPILDEKVAFTPFDAHYFHQQLWAFEKILAIKPKKHVDVASTYEFSGYVSKITQAVFVDYRPIDTKLKNLEIQRGDILDLDLADNSVESLSCLHVIEHIGLGRYGDSVDALGMTKACAELQRVLQKDGKFYLSTPIGKEKVYFNAHRVSSPRKILKIFNGLELASFSVVDDEGTFVQNTNPAEYEDLNYGCGMFEFTKR